MSMTMVAHVRDKSQTRGSARTLLLDLAIYANDCCGVAWPADTTLFHDVNISHQRIHELKNALERTDELVIVERPGTTNLYFVAWQERPMGGTPLGTRDGHDPSCPLRHARLAQRCMHQGPDGVFASQEGEGSENSDPSAKTGESEIPDTPGSEISERGGQNSLTRKQEKTIMKTPRRLRRPIALARDKPEMQNPFWCDAHGFCHGERLPDHRPDCAREREVLLTRGPLASLQCVGKPGNGQEKQICAYHGITHFPEKG
jgi:hypothetical protein